MGRQFLGELTHFARAENNTTVLEELEKLLVYLSGVPLRLAVLPDAESRTRAIDLWTGICQERGIVAEEPPD